MQRVRASELDDAGLDVWGSFAPLVLDDVVCGRPADLRTDLLEALGELRSVESRAGWYDAARGAEWRANAVALEVDVRAIAS